MLLFKKLLFLLTLQEQKKACLLLFMLLVMALLEMIGVASIMPFMAVLTNPEIVKTNFLLNNIFEISTIFGVQTIQQFLFFLGINVFILLVMSLTFKALTTYVQLRFIHMSEYSIGRRLLKIYLQQPYSWFLSRHSADLGKTILSEISLVINNGLSPIIHLISKTFVTITLIILLILIDPKIVLIVGLTIGLTYGIIYIFTRNFLSRIGKERLKSNQLRFTSVSETLGAIKEIKASRLEKPFIKKFNEPAKIFAGHQSSFQAISQIPRFALEAVAFGGILLVILYLMSNSGNFKNILPIIALYVFAGYRLMPALQQIYASVTQLRFVSPALDALYNDLKNLKKPEIIENENIVPLNKNIKIENLSYSYPSASSKEALNHINIVIPAFSKVGFVGSTGSGKTTIVDIILGLLEAKEGALKVDGEKIDKNNLKVWQSRIGYVPQHIYLSDDTISANIAFGVDPKNINKYAVEEAAKIANLHEFIINDLPLKYQTTVGERGVKLSGGQRQRIGIARALYRQPNLLILDEATSALDNITENKVIEALNIIHKKITIILIAHRINTVENCDKIFFLDNGKLKDQGTYQELITKNLEFRNLINVSKHL